MLGSASSKTLCLAGLLVLCSAWVTSAVAQIHLDRLSACENLAQIETKLRDQRVAPAGACRSPRNALEAELVRRTGNTASSICVVSAVPTKSLGDFSCVQPRLAIGSAGEIDCFRDARESDIDIYFHDYTDRYSGVVAAYLSKASMCQTGNGNATSAPKTTFPALLGSIAQMAFGFNLPLGSGRSSNS